MNCLKVKANLQNFQAVQKQLFFCMKEKISTLIIYNFNLFIKGILPTLFINIYLIIFLYFDLNKYKL